METKQTKTQLLQEHLAHIGACAEAREWAQGKSAKQAWTKCERADWLLWWAAQTSANKHTAVVLAACACARTALKYVPAGEDRPRLAIEAAERWANAPTEANRQAAEAAARAAWAAAARAARAAWAAAAAEAAEHTDMCRIIRRMLVCPWTESEE